MERTLVILKPDAFDTRKAGAVIQRLEEAGFAILGAKMIRLNRALLGEHYAHIADRPFYPEVESFMMSRPVLVLAVEGNNAIARMRNLLGPTNSANAPAGTIRGDWGTDAMRNLVHASDAPEAAAIELKRFFRDDEILSR